MATGPFADGTVPAPRGRKCGRDLDLGPVTVPSTNGPVATVPLESKWVEQGWKSEARTIDAKFGRGILATKSALDTTGNVWAVPAPLLALLIQ